MQTIVVKNLSKYFTVYKKQPGFIGALKSVFNRKHYDVKAVDDVSFEISEGELVGFIGPNGAGKTTTLKCLSGLLYPTSGKVSVLGFKPFDRKKEYLKQISLVMGQKNQLWWDLPPMDTFLLNKEIYEIPKIRFDKVVEELSELLEIKKVLHIQVRKLSLGERMKAELVAAILHQPKVLFLDEPTIGLDVVMQQKLRNFIKEYNNKYKATILLTSHYMDDVKELCERVIIINNGKVIYDGKLDDIVKKYSTYKILTIIFKKAVSKHELLEFGTIKDFDAYRAVLTVPFDLSNHVAAKILEKFSIEDLNIEEPAIEDIIRFVYTK